MNKKRVAILFGGKSAEHEVSVESAYNIIKAIDKKKYELIIIGIDHKGDWYLYNNLDLNNLKLVDPDDKKDYFQKLAVIPGDSNGQLYNLIKEEKLVDIDVVFPVLHGPFGEDGTIQGLLKIINTPFVGAGVLGSAVAMDKDIMKRLLRDNNINIADYMVFQSEDNINTNLIINKLGLPLFVKPANLGSSVGVNKVNKKDNLKNAIKYALEFDNKVIVEEYINGREIECSVLGNSQISASLPGEIKPKSEFYSYEAKYVDEKGAVLSFPADISKKMSNKVREVSLKVYKTLESEGMARVDCFLTKNKEVIVNEINTIPGFTKISMYPKLWEISGIEYSKLIDKLIELAVERFEKEVELKNDYKK